MTEEKIERSKWHRAGIAMSLVALVVVIAAGVLLNMGLSQAGLSLAHVIPENWHIVTRHSDTPSQVIGGIEALEAEATFRVKELALARDRALEKADDARKGKGEVGENVTDPAARERLLATAPEWDKVAARADQAIANIRAAQ